MNQYLRFVKTLKNRTPVNILNFLKKFKTEGLLHPSVCVALSILLTMSVATADGQGDFWRFQNVIKSYLRRPTTQERSSSLVTLQTEGSRNGASMGAPRGQPEGRAPVLGALKFR
jgi:hypothetical protein